MVHMRCVYVCVFAAAATAMSICTVQQVPRAPLPHNADTPSA